MASELSVEGYLVARVEALGGWCPKTEPICAGFPDRGVFLPGGRLIFVETKKATGRLAPIQKTIHRTLRYLGFQVEVIWTREGVDDFVRGLDG